MHTAHRIRAALLLPLLLGACASAAAGPPQTAPRPMASPHDAPPASGYIPHRVYDVAAAAFIDYEAFIARSAGADVVLFGEQHGHAPTHRMQLALLEGLARRGGATLSMEMFERDVAHIVSGYVSGQVSHEVFLAHTRPWPNYFPDYHPLIERARASGWTVIAANVPRSIANQVAREGLAAVNALDTGARAHAAAELQCPSDAYRTRFFEEMRKHPSGHADESAEAEEARLHRYYEAQCVKDETMAESMARALGSATKPIVHYTGAFHSDYGDGIAVRLRRRVPGARVMSITTVPVTDLDAADPAPHRERADYLLFTLSAPARQ
jgi:uncharacterized iron-regulated protein